MTVELQNSLWNAVYTTFYSEMDQGAQWTRESGGIIARLAQINFFKNPIDELPSYGFEYLIWLKNWFFSAEWYEAYDYIEWLGSYGSHWDGWIKGNPEYDRAANFRQIINAVLERENSGFRFVGSDVAPVTNPAEVAEVNAALQKSGAFASVGAHIGAASALLSDRKSPDFRNSIKESISAVEAAARIAAGDPKATLGDALKQLSKETDLHGALKEGFSKLYGWTSDANGIRHSMMELPQLSLADARYMLVTCSAFANYLVDRVATK